MGNTSAFKQEICKLFSVSRRCWPKLILFLEYFLNFSFIVLILELNREAILIVGRNDQA